MQPGALHLFYLLAVYQLHIFSFFLLFAKTIAQPKFTKFSRIYWKTNWFQRFKNTLLYISTITTSCTSPQSHPLVHLHINALLYISTIRSSLPNLTARNPRKLITFLLYKLFLEGTEIFFCKVIDFHQPERYLRTKDASLSKYIQSHS